MQDDEKQARHDLLIKIQVKAERLRELCQSVRELKWKLDDRNLSDCVREYLHISRTRIKDSRNI